MYTILIIFITILIVLALVVSIVGNKEGDFSGTAVSILYIVAFIAFYHLLTNYI